MCILKFEIWQKSPSCQKRYPVVHNHGKTLTSNVPRHSRSRPPSIIALGTPELRDTRTAFSFPDTVLHNSTEKRQPERVKAKM